ncbi:C40 family peptidase [Faunimonas sp. B44]|uniref:C40 family peptidase n=1 Tax=Faunimonas sp. B44 TaxID=3461493 RepID=UPI004044CB20
MTGLDPRLNAFRPDLADAALRGRVEAERFAEAVLMRVTAAAAPVRREARPDGMRLTEALAGEAVRVFETTEEGWAWGQLVADRYVGWLPLDSLSATAPVPTHRVAALRTPVFSGPDIKSEPMAALSIGARVSVTGEAQDRNARYALIAPAGAVVMQHLRPIGDAAEADFVAVAERFLHVPYLWGGKTSLGLDCSALVQIALGAAGVEAPRDSDMQQQDLGMKLPIVTALPELRRGDLVFWPGHVGIMQDPERLLHANAHHMAVASEPLADTLARFGAKGITMTAVRRLA